jgi:hypothetical protein
MKLPRFSIARIMAIIILAALNLAAIRALDGTSTEWGGLIVFGSMPMASILVLGLPCLVKGVWGRSQTHPFLIGFEGVGWTILLFYTGASLLFPSFIGETLVKGMRVLGITNSPDPVWQVCMIIAGVLFLPLPQLVAALIGGWLNQRFKIRIIIERRQEHRLGTTRSCGSPGRVSTLEPRPVSHQLPPTRRSEPALMVAIHVAGIDSA